MHILVLENIRSAYNTGVMLRTCDALWWKAVLSGFTPDPQQDEKVAKTALWAEKSVVLHSFWNPKEARARCRQQAYLLIAAEKNETSLSVLWTTLWSKQPVALIMGNENTGILQETLDDVDHVVHIPMLGMKESLNVAEAAAILMWELSRK